ncbi:hypothetical protein B0H13DRAFT_2328646 [Mycena leptocephala]|nr:hypothetical protein B0H13DRAFT_2328646 [Mycena leptocephala]
MNVAPFNPEVHSRDANVREKPFDLPRDKGFQIRSFLSQLVGWPAKVICGHLILQLATWIFFATIQKRGFIRLRSLGPDWFNTLATVIHWVFTTLSTGLAFASSYLFSWGVGKSIALHLNGEGMSLATFGSSLKILSRSVIFDRSNWKWSVMSIALVASMGVQTSGWSSLITPTVITVDTSLRGRELDLSSPSLRQMQSSGALDYCIFNSSTLSSFVSGQTESGYAAVKSTPDFPTSFTLMDQSFNISTGGILPSTLFDVNAGSWFPSLTTIPAIVSPFLDFSIDVPASYSMSQQGFTADVACTFQNLTADTTPSLNLQLNLVKEWTDAIELADNATIASVTMSSNCIVPDRTQLNQTSAYIVVDPNYGDSSYVLMITCGGSGEKYSMIFKGSGAYSFMKTTVCTFSPKITRVNVDYSDANSFSGTIGTTTLFNGVIPDMDGPAGLSAVFTIENMMFFSQAASSNIMGNQLIALLDVYSFDDETILKIISAAWQSTVDPSSGLVSPQKTDLSDGVPDNMKISTSGFFHSQIVGWKNASLATFFFLIPGTLIAISTICVVVVAVARHTNRMPVGKLAFDPTNAMHLVAASATGDLNTVLTGTDKTAFKAVEGVDIVLGTASEQGPALIRK